ncbi:MAG: S41 family peptidase [Myxococcota bacterium]
MNSQTLLLRLTPAIALLGVASPSSADQLTCGGLPGIIRAFERRHYAVKDLTDELRQRTVDQFLRMIDSSRTMLLAADVERLKKELPATFDQLKDGGCTPLNAAAKILLQRSEEDEKLAKDFLGDKYQLDESVELMIEPDKRGYAKTPEERTALIQKLIHFQISNYLAAGQSLDAAKKLLVHRYELSAKRLKERLAPEDLPGLYAEAFAEALDPHSSFMSQDVLEDFQISMKLSLEGIGAALIADDGLIVIETLVPGGQAEKSGMLRTKDKIIAVAQDGEKPVSTIDMDLREVVRMIRGKKGTKVTLTVLRDGKEAQTFDVTIVRDKIDVKEQAAKIRYETRKIGKKSVKLGIIDLPSFYGSSDNGGRSSFADMKQLVGEAVKEKVDGLVLDLTKNGGGLLDDAVKISGLFLKEGGIVATKDGSGQREVLADEDDDVLYSGPLVVLTSPASASASEILAGALKDYRRALIVGGEHTFGKGTVQTLEPLPHNLGALKVTTGMFFLPGGRSTQQMGVKADVRVPSLLDGVDVGEKTLDYSLAPGSTEPFVDARANADGGAEHWKPITDVLVQGLTQKSKERIAHEPKFTEIQKEVEQGRSRGLVKLADLRKKSSAKKPEKNDKEDERIKGLEAAFVSEGLNVLLDLIQAQS